MAWTDPATKNQISALYHMCSNKPIKGDIKKRFKWLKEHKPTRKELSEELGRVKELCIANKRVYLWNEDMAKELFNSSIWEGYKNETI